MTDPLKPFKISEQVKQPVDRPRSGGARSSSNAPPAEAPPSAGFPRIEAIVDGTGLDLAGLEKREAELSSKATGKGPPKERAAAQKALLAYQKTRSLIAHLLETKEKMRTSR